MKITRIKLPGLLRSRKSRKLSRATVGAKAWVGHNTLYQAEHGVAINREMAERIAKVLGVKLRSLQS